MPGFGGHVCVLDSTDHLHVCVMDSDIVSDLSYTSDCIVSLFDAVVLARKVTAMAKLPEDVGKGINRFILSDYPKWRLNKGQSW